MTVRELLNEHVRSPYRILFRGRAMYDSTLTEYDCPAFITECLVLDAWTTTAGMTLIEI